MMMRKKSKYMAKGGAAKKSKYMAKGGKTTMKSKMAKMRMKKK